MEPGMVPALGKREGGCPVGFYKLHVGPQLWGHPGLSLVIREEPPYALILARGWPGRLW